MPILAECINSAIERAAAEEPWEGYYFVRGLEMENLLGFVNLNNLGKVLDMGCGNGFTSYLMSKSAEEVVAADLRQANPETHSPGLNTARITLSKLASGKVKIYESSIEKTPFPDETFDTVYAGYVLQYLKDKTRALKELKRIVKKEGIIILVLPNFTERIYAFFQFYLYLGIKALKALSEMILRKAVGGGHKKEFSGRISKFKEDYRYFPFSGPHGAYRNSASELIAHIPLYWNREFRKSGLKIVNTFTTAFLPYPLLLTFSVRIAETLSVIFRAFTRFYGNKPILRYLGYNYCVVLKK